MKCYTVSTYALWWFAVEYWKEKQEEYEQIKKDISEK
jgi:hypothetical protein